MDKKQLILTTICIVIILVMATACILTIFSYAGYVNNQIKVDNSMYISCPDYLDNQCTCNVVGDSKYMIDECIKFMGEVRE